MTLIVSLHIPDGIILAGDSLATMMQEIQIEGEVEVDCPQCGHKHVVKHTVPYPAPSTTFSYAQKIFPFLDKYGIGTFGAGMLAGKSIYFAIREFEATLKGGVHKQKTKNVEDIANLVGNHLHRLLDKQLTLEGKKLDEIPDNGFVLGVQVVGYGTDGPRIYEAQVGKQVRIIEPIGRDRHGCAVSGQMDVPQAIWGLGKRNPQQKAQYGNFSVQDAIEYAKFLIRATASHQQFSSQMPNVGGDIDIALITPFEGFKWIQQKPLSKLLGSSN